MLVVREDYEIVTKIELLLLDNNIVSFVRVGGGGGAVGRKALFVLILNQGVGNKGIVLDALTRPVEILFERENVTFYGKNRTKIDFSRHHLLIPINLDDRYYISSISTPFSVIINH